MGLDHANRGFPKSLRLRRSGDFALLARDRSGPHLNRPLLSLSARARSPAVEPFAPSPASEQAHSPVRVGFTASRRQASRAVARNMVKRILREAVRHSELATRTGGSSDPSGAGIDVVMRLRARLPVKKEQGWSSVKRELRMQADWLLQRMSRQATPSVDGAARPPVAGPSS